MRDHLYDNIAEYICVKRARVTHQSLAVEQRGATAVADGPVCEAQNMQDLLCQ